jgi:hypothetical protein
MRKHLMIGTALVLLASTGAWAADNSAAPAAPATEAATPSSAPITQGAAPTDAAVTHHGHRHQWTLEEARKRAHARADKLDKMTEAEYEAQQEKRHAAHEKWKSMTPEERAAAKKARHDKWLAKHQGASTAAPATAPAAPGQ